MKRGLGIFLVGLGVFLLALGGLFRFYVVPQLAKAPLVPGSTTGNISTTTNRGVATKLFDPGALATGGNPNRVNVPLLATRTTRGDVLADQSDDAKSGDLAVYDSFQNVTDDKGTTIDASTLRVAFNRVTSELSNCCGANVDGTTVDMNGVNPLKFPFWVEQKSYNLFDTTLNKAIPIDFTGTKDFDGLTAYVFHQKIEPTQTSQLDVPGNLVGSPDATYKAARFYENDRTLWVDPTTGSILGGTEVQHQYLTGPDGTEKVTILAAPITTTDETLNAAVQDAKDATKLLNLFKTTVPIVCLILGLIGLGVGAWLIGRRDESSDGDRALA